MLVLLSAIIIMCAVSYEVRVENIKSPEDHVEAVLERVDKRHIAATYDVNNWTNYEDFLEQIAYKSGRLLKVSQCQSLLSLTGMR